MKATRTINWTTAKGNPVELTVEITREVSNKTAYADGYNINTGKETVELTNITLRINGKVAASSIRAPHVLTRESYKNSYDKLIAAGAYARLGDAYIGQKDYETIMDAYNAAVAEINAPVTEEAKAEAADYETVKTAEVAKETAIVNAKPETHGPGWCDKCQSYCWGDCESN